MALHIKVRKTRPRVYLHEDLLPEILKRTETTHVEEWSQLAVWSRGILKSPAEHRLREERLPGRARRAAFVYALGRAEEAAELGVEFARRLADAPATPAALEALAQLYDSLWAVLPGELRAELASWMAEGAEAVYDERVKGAAILDEARSEAVAPVLAAGLALYGDEPRANALIGKAVHAARDLMGTLQYFLEEDGGFPLGWEGSLVHAGAFPKLALLAESGLGQGLPADIPWLTKYAEFLEAGAREGEGDAPDGPHWPDGGATGRRCVDLWRVLAFAAARTANPAAARLMEAFELLGHQDEKILYEARPRSKPDGARAAPPAALLHRRAGVAILREYDDALGVEVLFRCLPALLDGGPGEAGAISISVGGKLLLGVPGHTSILSVSGSTGPTSFPRTRRELNLPEHRLSEILAFEAGVGDGAFDWVQADVTPACSPSALSARRTAVFARAMAERPHTFLAVADDVFLAESGAEVAEVHHFPSQPSTDGGVVEATAEGLRLRCIVVLPQGPRIWADEPLWQAADPRETPGPATAARSAWRVRVAPTEHERRTRVCQVFFVSEEKGGEPPGAAATFVEGALGAEAAGRLVLFGDEDVLRIEGVTRSEVHGVAGVGLAPRARVTIEVAGGPRVEGTTSDFGATWLEADIPAETGFVMEVEPPDRPPSGRSREEAAP